MLRRCRGFFPYLTSIEEEKETGVERGIEGSARTVLGSVASSVRRAGP